MIFTLILHPQKSLTWSHRHHLLMHITQNQSSNLEKLRQAIPILGIKLWNEIPGRMRDMSKKMWVFKRKLFSVLFEILKDKDDYLDATMITRE